MGWWRRLLRVLGDTGSQTYEHSAADAAVATPIRPSGSSLSDDTQLTLVHALKAGDPDVRGAAAHSLSRSQLDEPIQQIVYYLLKDNNPGIREAAAHALSGTRLDETIQQLVYYLLKDNDPAIGAVAARALGR